MDNDEILTVEQVADLLRMSAGYVYRLIRHRKLPALRFGKSVRVRRGDLVWYLRKKVPPSLARAPLEALEEMLKEAPGAAAQTETEDERS